MPKNTAAAPSRIHLVKKDTGPAEKRNPVSEKYPEHGMNPVSKGHPEHGLNLALRVYLVDAEARRLTPKSLTFYRERITQFLHWLDAEYPDCTTLEQLSANHFREYLISLEKRGLAGASQHSAARAVRAWLNWCVQEEMLVLNPMRTVRMPRVEKKILPALTEKEVKRILSVCKTERDTAIVYFLLDTGVRASELVSLDIADVDMEAGCVLVRQGKGRKDRTTYFGTKARKTLQKYLSTRPRPRPSDPLFHSGRDVHERLSVWGLQNLLKRLARKSGVAECHPHAFRRTFALWNLRQGMNIYALAQLMGHSDISVLRQYLPLVENDLATTHRQAGAVDHIL